MNWNWKSLAEGTPGAWPWLWVLMAAALFAHPTGMWAQPSGQAKRTPAQFERASGTRSWSFPRDHGQHPRFRLEWWYYTGILKSVDGRSFGYQVTFFRRGLRANPSPRASAWRVGSLYLAHLAISPLSASARGGFRQAIRSGRDSLGTSGAAAGRQQVWVGNWRADPLSDGPEGVRLEARDREFGCSLRLVAERPPVLHGQGGLDRKGEEPGQASWYYSVTRLRTEGKLWIGGEEVPVSGTSWMDHEFGTSQLGSDQVGWDWFALRLDNGQDLMLYRMRTRSGGVSPASGGTLLDAAGKVTHLRFWPEGHALNTAEVAASAESGGLWHSPATGARYPLTWRIAVPALGLELNVEPALESQEWVPGRGLPFGYWEGAVWVGGTQGGRPVRGEGYLELTGYAGDIRESFR